MTRNQVRPVTRVGVAWRVVLSVLGIVALVNGSVRMSDDVFPFGPMSQYAFAPKPDDTVLVTGVDARLADGRRFEIPMNWSSGIRRADLEGQLPAILANPRLLSPVVSNWESRHPGSPRITEVWLIQEQHRLADPTGRASGQVVLLHWTVPR